MIDYYVFLMLSSEEYFMYKYKLMSLVLRWDENQMQRDQLLNKIKNNLFQIFELC